MPAVIVPPAGGFAIGSPVTDPLSVPRIAVFLGDAIDPVSREYRSIHRGVDPLEARLLEKLLVQRDSGSAVRGTGQNFASVRFIDDSTESLLKAEVALAWKDEIENREISNLAVAYASDGNNAGLSISFKRSNGKTSNLSLPLLSLLGRLQ